jgi:hypothetical protein
MLTHPFCFSQISGGCSCNAKVQLKYQDNPCHGATCSSSYGDRWSNNSFEFHYMQNLCCYAGWDWPHKETRLNIIDEVSFAGYHSLELESFPAEGYGTTNFNTGELPCVFFWCRFWNYRQRRHLQAGRWNILGTISHLFSGTERHSSLQELPSTATDHAQDAQWRTLRSRS